MYRVYFSNGYVVDFEDFGDDQMSEAIACVAQHRDEFGHTFVTMVSGNVPGLVGKMGVSNVGPDYNWTKRRSTALRKDTDGITRETEDWPEEA